ncbi:major facilitator superfamily domain-containing protein 6 [Prorops nasuta]|uniref:major facilitator superfamily domain-containing protein 6 n=1 Tax=Prorops nasuta TaxID=863751 RepID=UPI0034CEA08B
MLGNINKDLLPIKTHYFLFNAATGPIVPFLPTVAKQLGFSSLLVGTIYTILPISGLVAKPLFGILADKFRLHKTFFIVFQIIVALSFFSINIIPEIENSANATLNCKNFRHVSAVFLSICSKHGFSESTLGNVLTDAPHTAQCQLSCQKTQNTNNELCKNWHIQEFCTNSTDSFTSNTFNFRASFDISNDIKVKNCVYLHIRNATFSDKTAHIPECESFLHTSCLAKCHNNLAFNQLLREADQVHKDPMVKVTSTYQFHVFLWAAIISWIGMAVVVVIADAICFGILGEERRKEYGKQKMWGSIGFGIFGIAAGYLVDLFSGNDSQKDYTCIFYIMLIAMICDILVSSRLKKKDTTYSDIDPSLLLEIIGLIKKGSVLVFIWWCIGAGMCTAVVWNFLFWYTDDLAKSSDLTVKWIKTLQGLLTGVQCFLGELPFNFISGAVLRKLGHVNVMSIVLIVYAVRFMAYSVVSNVWIFLLLEILHGPSLGLCWPTMVSYGDKVTPAGTKSTVQGLIGGVFEGIGVSCGSLICGWLMNTYGGIIAFRIFSAGALIWLSLFWLFQLLLRKTKAYPIHHGHNHLASYANPDEAIIMTMSQEMETY